MLSILIDNNKLREFCKKHHIKKLAFFRSVLRKDFRPDSDIDVLVEFEPDQGPGFLRLYDIEQELSSLLNGRKMDLVTEKFLNHRIRDLVLADAEVQYAEG